jgi:membrane protease YdiL (CAAX protease family)
MILVLSGLCFSATSRLTTKVEGRIWHELASELLGLSVVLLATLLMARFERRSFWDFGFGGSARGRNLALGAVTGALSITFVIIIMCLCGGLTLAGHSSFGLGMLGNALLYGVFFLAVAFLEDGLCSGYALVNLSKAISFWPAVILLSAFFALNHVPNEHENNLGILSAGVFSIVLGYSFLRFGSLWFAFGFHASWDFGETFIYGVPNSGIIMPGSLLTANLSGPEWLTGGGVGPEASVLVIAVLALLVVVIRKASLEPVRTQIDSPANDS